MDKKSYQRMYEAKWGGAPWLNEDRDTDTKKEDPVVVIDIAPPSCPEVAASITPLSSRGSPTAPSTRTTMDHK